MTSTARTLREKKAASLFELSSSRYKVKRLFPLDESVSGIFQPFD